MGPQHHHHDAAGGYRLDPDASQDGAAVLVSGIHELKKEFEYNGVKIGNLQVDDRDGQELQVFFVVAPDGLCYYFHEPLGVAD